MTTSVFAACWSAFKVTAQLGRESPPKCWGKSTGRDRAGRASDSNGDGPVW